MSTRELAAKRLAGDCVVLDASWPFPPGSRDARAEYSRKRIPGAVFWDIDVIATPATTSRGAALPHMLPSAAMMRVACSNAGIGSLDDDIVVYDTSGVFSAPRLWWTFRAFGFTGVTVLDRGLPGWVSDGEEVEDVEASARFADGQGVQGAAAGEVRAVHGTEARALEGMRDGSRRAWTLGQVEQLVGGVSAEAVATGEADTSGVAPSAPLLVDARPHGRFVGADPEPRAGLARGHAPGSASAPFPELFAEDGRGGARFKSAEELRGMFARRGVDPARPGKIITSCGSGVTAAALSLALFEAGRDDGEDALYDGSWAEYGER